MTISVGNLIVAGGASVDTSEVLSALNKQGLKVWVGTKTQRDALPENVKNDDKITFLTYDSEEDIYLIVDTIISYSKTWSSVKISTELAKKINSSDVYTKTEVMTLINSKVASALKYRGAVATVAALPSTGQENGDSYYVQADGYMYAWSSDYSDWQALGSATDMTDYYTKSEVDALLADMAVKFQYTTMPTADSTTVGKIIQYTGADTNDYKNGYWYKGIDNGDSTYSWIIDPAYYTSDVVDALHTAKYYNATNAPDCNTLTETYVLVNAGNSHVENHYPAQDLFFVKTIYSEDSVDGFQTAVAYGAIDSTQKGIIYSRVKTSGTWSDWKKLAVANGAIKYLRFYSENTQDVGTVIKSNAVPQQTTIMWIWGSGTTGTPDGVNGSSYIYYVNSHDDYNNGMSVTAYAINGNDTYRKYYLGSWSNWEKLASANGTLNPITGLSDANSATASSSIKYAVSSDTTTNLPTDIDVLYGLLEISQNSVGNALVQTLTAIYYGTNNEALTASYHRSAYFNGNNWIWSAWQRFITESDISTLSRATAVKVSGYSLASSYVKQGRVVTGQVQFWGGLILGIQRDDVLYSGFPQPDRGFDFAIYNTEYSEPVMVQMTGEGNIIARAAISKDSTTIGMFSYISKD